MTGPHPAVAASRLAVRRALVGLVPPDGTVLVACSGGADSLALLAATVFELRPCRDHPGGRVIGVTVDHGLQEGSAARAASVVAQMTDLGVTETMTIRVRVEAPGLGPEAAARQARYAALSQAALSQAALSQAALSQAALSQAAQREQASGVAVVLLGHTLDDQAETVLLGLTRGSGGRSLAGMRRSYREDGVTFVRPLLDLTRAQTEAACLAEGIDFWSDPHNDDPRFSRSRLRHRVLPVLEEELGPGVAQALARTADLLREDADALDDLAVTIYSEVAQDGGLTVSGLEPWTGAVAHRILRRAAVAAGCPPSELFRVHVLALGDLTWGPDSGRQVQLPGHVTAYRVGDELRFRSTRPAT